MDRELNNEDTTKAKNEMINKLKKYGILVDVNGQITYDKSQSGMKLRLPKVYLLRHSYTDGTDKHEFMSDYSDNSHLTQRGKDKVKQNLKNFCKENDIDVVIVCSDLPRVVETAEALKEVNSNIPFIYETKYKGINNGGWEGHTKETLKEDERESYIQREEKHNIFAKSSQGESWGQVLVNTIDLIKKLNKEFESKKVLLVTQGSISRGIDILTRKHEDPWHGYDTKKLFNFEKNNKQDNYGVVSLVQDEMIKSDGMIHGRFQSFHKGHYEEHFKRALSRVPKGHKLYVGITKPFKADNGMSVGDDHRDSKESNPYTFEQRRAMILRSVELDSEISDRLKDIIVIPWPLNNEQELNKVVDKLFPDKSKVVQFMNIIPGDGWEYEKQKIFEEMGFETVNLVNETNPRITCATDVRGLKNHPKTYTTQVKYTKANISWEDLVPKGTAEIIKMIDQNPDCIKTEYKSVDEFLSKLPALDTNAIARGTLARNPEMQELVDSANSFIKDIDNKNKKIGEIDEETI